MFRISKPVTVTINGAWTGPVARNVTLTPVAGDVAAQVVFPTVPLGDSDAVSALEDVVVVGYPGIGGRSPTFTRTHHGGLSSSAVARPAAAGTDAAAGCGSSASSLPRSSSSSLPPSAITKEPQRFIKFTGALNSGGSGGALLDAAGRLVGMPTHSPQLGVPHKARFSADGKSWKAMHMDFDPYLQPLNHAITINSVRRRYAELLGCV